jgi:NAD(P)-dependent dehydrogenase (short-subunit alcohol dehydrogenase family)
VITGTSSGIGTVLAYKLLKRGATVVSGNSDIEKAEFVLETRLLF